MRKLTADFYYETGLWKKSTLVIGIDEVGRGALAGPFTLGAVAFPILMTDTIRQRILSMGITDSKLLTARKRLKLSAEIKDVCLFTRTISIHNNKINTLGISESWKEGVVRIVKSFRKEHPGRKIHLLIDGLPIKHIPYINRVPRTSIVKGDSRSISIAAASIIAKVERDLFMNLYSLRYPNYRWSTNKGYGTKAHCEAIKLFGPTRLHRTIFLRNIIKSV